jgi:hypothetical protein
VAASQFHKVNNSVEHGRRTQGLNLAMVLIGVRLELGLILGIRLGYVCGWAMVRDAVELGEGCG